MNVPETAIVEFSEFEANLVEFKQKYDDVIYDLTDPKQEKQARSDRRTIGSVIASLDAKHQEIKAPLKVKVDVIDGERKRIKDELLEVQGKIKSQIEAHEAAIQEHADMLQGRVDAIRSNADITVTEGLNAEGLTQLINTLNNVDVDDSYEDRKADATLAQVETKKELETLLSARLLYEEEQAELDRLRKEKIEREQKEHDERIKREAAEAAKNEAESKAISSLRKAKREQEEKDRKHKEELEQAAQATREAEQAAAHAAKEERERIEREQAEHQHQEELRREAEETKKSRRKYKNKIHQAAVDSLIAYDVDIKEARRLISLIKDGLISQVSIYY